LLQVFPDITICKVTQLNALYTSTMNYAKYISDTSSRKARWPIDRVDKFIPDFDEDLYNSTWAFFMSKDGYYNSLPRDVQLTENEEVANNPFVIYCFASMWDESEPWNCSEAFKAIWHRKYYKCRSLQLPDSMRRVGIATPSRSLLVDVPSRSKLRSAIYLTLTLLHRTKLRWQNN